MKRKYDLVAIAKESDILKRCQEISEEFQYSYMGLSSVDEFAEKEQELGEVPFILISAESAAREADIAGMVQVVRQLASGSAILVTIDSKLDPSVAVFVKKSGANFVLLGDEIRNTSKLEFITSQRIRASYLPVKIKDFTPEMLVPFSLFYLMPLNRKFLPILKAGDTLTAQKMQRLEEVGEIYIRREDVEKFRQYTSQTEDRSALGLVKRCRAQFLSLFNSYVDLILNISDQSEGASYTQGALLYTQCEKLSTELMMTLGAVGDGWEIVNNSAIGEFGSVERAPATAAYAGLLSLQSGIGDQTPVMAAALICDIGLLDLHPRVTRKIRQGATLSDLHPEDQDIFRLHPVASLNKALSRKLQIPDAVKNIILCTHEQVDQKGFPNRPRSDKIPMESMLIQVSEQMDRKSLIRMGEARPNMKDIRQQIFKENYETGSSFSIIFLEKIKGVLAS